MADWTTPSAIHSKIGESSPYYATRTIDENVLTEWRYVYPVYHWIIFDMGATKTITKIRINQSTSEINRFGTNVGLYVYVGDDPANLGAAVWEGILNASEWQESGAFEKSGRYIKLLSKSNGNAQRIYEFDAMASGGVAHSKTVAEIVGFVDNHSKVQHHKKTVAEKMGFVDEHDKDKCKKCEPSSVILTF